MSKRISNMNYEKVLFMKLHQIMGLKVKEIDSFNSFMTKVPTTEKPVH